MTEVQWRRNPDFAEVAEALKLRTDQILAAMVLEETIPVLYIPSDDNPEEVWLATLKRDEQGILAVSGEPTQVFGAMEEIRQGVEKRLQEKLGDPQGRSKGEVAGD